MVKKRTKKEKEKHERYGFIPAGLFIGLGIGLLTGQVAGFLMIGLGVGFLIGYFGKVK